MNIRGQAWGRNLPKSFFFLFFILAISVIRGLLYFKIIIGITVCPIVVRGLS